MSEGPPGGGEEFVLPLEPQRPPEPSRPELGEEPPAVDGIAATVYTSDDANFDEPQRRREPRSPLVAIYRDRAESVVTAVTQPFVTWRRRKQPWSSEKIDLWAKRAQELALLDERQHSSPPVKRAVFGAIKTAVGGGIIATEQVYDVNIDPKVLAVSFFGGALASLGFTAKEAYQGYVQNRLKAHPETIKAGLQVSGYAGILTAVEAGSIKVGAPIDPTLMGAGVLLDGVRQGRNGIRDGMIGWELTRARNKIRLQKQRQAARRRAG